MASIQNSWKNPYTITSIYYKSGCHVEMTMKLRYWHPRLWWMALKFIWDSGKA